MKLVMNAALGKPQLKQRFAKAPESVQVTWVEDEDGAVRELASADAMICPDKFYSARVAEAVRTSSKMRWVQLLSAGYDTVQKQGVPANVTLCNAGEAYAPAVATHAIALLL